MQDQITQDQIDAAAAEIQLEVPQEIIHQIPVDAPTVEALSFDEKLAQYSAHAASGYNE